MFDAVKNKLNNVKNDIYSAVYAPPTESTFFKEGKLTPQEFLASGDQLIGMCPQWKWMPASADKYVNKYLPLEKQYLLMQKVPCDQRVRELMETISVNAAENDDEILISDGTGNEDKKNGSESTETVGQKVNLETKQHFVEGEKQAEGNAELSKGQDGKVLQNDEEDDENVIVVEAPVERRYYDLSITYDLAYYTPHLFLNGIDEDNVPLKQQQIFEDIVSHYSNKTVTFETNPQTGIQSASLHPCKHSQVIKHMIDNIQEAGGVIHSHQCLFVFLKFLQSVIPTIQYDIAGEIIFDE